MFKKIIFIAIGLISITNLIGQCISDISHPVTGSLLENNQCIAQVQINATYCCTDDWSTECQKLYDMCTGENSISAFIHVDQFGYRLNDNKVAVLSNPQTGFNSFLSYAPSASIELRRAIDNTVAFTGTAIPFDDGIVHEESGDQGWWFDFSTVTTEGAYYVFDPINNERSAEFEIKDAVYSEVLRQAGRMYYYNRAGIAKEAQYAGSNWEDQLAFDGPGQHSDCHYYFDQDNADLSKDLSGGWYDAGDFNKYTTFTNYTLHNLMWAYIENPDAFTDDWNIPESGNGVPDIIDEIKWELDWMLKMNNEDGSTYLKMGSVGFDENVLSPPSLNVDPFYYIGTCSSASIAVTSVFAQAAKLFMQFPIYADYADLLENRAIVTADYVFPLLLNDQLDENCDNGEVVAGDADWSASKQRIVAVTAAIYLYDLTADENYNFYIIDNIEDTENPVNDSPWSLYNPHIAEAKLHYLTLENTDASVVDPITNSFEQSFLNVNNSGIIFGESEEDLYKAQMQDWAYHAGSNAGKSATGILNLLVEKSNLNPSLDSSYRQKAQDMMHYIHGVNPLGLVYLTNMYDYGGDRCVNETAHEWFQHESIYDNALSSEYGPPPGYLVGGPVGEFENYQGEQSPSPPANQPIQKGFWGFNDYTYPTWAITECAIYYQAAYIRLLSEFVENETPTGVNQFEVNTNKLSLYPNPVLDKLNLISNFKYGNYKIFNSNGILIKMGNFNVSTKLIDISFLESGFYMISLESDDGKISGINKFVKH